MKEKVFLYVFKKASLRTAGGFVGYVLMIQTDSRLISVSSPGQICLNYLSKITTIQPFIFEFDFDCVYFTTFQKSVPFPKALLECLQC